MPIYPPVPSWLDLVYRVSPKMRKLERKDCQLIKCDGDMAAGALSDWSSGGSDSVIIGGLHDCWSSVAPSAQFVDTRDVRDD